MKKTDWKDTAELIGIAAIVASLVFVGLQMRQEQQIAIAQVFSESDSATVDFAALLSDNDEVWVKGLEGAELTRSEQVKFNALAYAFDRLRFNQYHRTRRLESFSPELAVEFYAYELYQYPGLRQYFEHRREMGRMRASSSGRNPDGDGFRAQVEQRLEALDQSSPPKPEPSYVPN